MDRTLGDMAGCRIDPHVKVLDDRVKASAIANGVDAIVYAPHYTPWPSIVEQARRYSDEELLVVPAREVFTGGMTDRRHVLALDLEYPVPDFLDLETTMDILAKQDACVIAPHPGYLSMSLSLSDLLRYQAQFHAVEVYNPKFLPWHEARASRIAERIGAPKLASSYAHLRRSVGSVSIEVGSSLECPADVIAAIRTGDITAINISTAPRRWQVSLGELMHLGWENTIQRLARALRADLPPTHPSSPLYDQYYEGFGD